MRLEEVCAHITDGKHGDCENQADSGFYFLSCKDVSDGTIHYEDARQITEADFRDTHRRTKLEPWDILITNSGTIGRMALAPANDLTSRTTFQKSVAILKPIKEKANPRFLFYMLHAERDRLISFAGGTAQKNLLLRDLRAFKINVPCLSTQCHVASILSAYDDLVENNTRRIKISEQMAQMLYREWFVNFRFPGHEKVKMVESEVGQTPADWKMARLEDVCLSLEDGDWIESKDQGGTDYRLLQVSNIGVDEFVETGNLRFITRETYERLHCREVNPGELLVSRMPKPTGRAWLVKRMPWPMITAVDVAILKPNPETVDSLFLTYFLNSTEHLSRVEKRTTGTTRPRISRRDLSSLPIALAPLALQQKLGCHIEAAHKLGECLREKNSVLRTTRDLLLPKLVSGEVSVGQVESEAVVQTV